MKRSLNTPGCGLEDQAEDLADPRLSSRWPDGQANGLRFAQYSKDLQTPGLGKKICKEKKIENTKKAKERKCFKAGDEQGGLGMLKA